jgi:hypothetical protein
MSFILLFLLISLLFLVVMLVLIFSAAASVMGRERPVQQEEPTCGGCGYIVKNMAEPVCAVCHSEFHIVGIHMPPPPAGNSAAAAWLAFRRVSGLSLGVWTILIGGIALGFTVVAGEHYWPYYSESTTHLEARPKSTGYDSVLISTTQRLRARGRTQQGEPVTLSKSVVVDLRTAKGTRTLEADLLAPSLTYIDAGGTTITAAVLPTKETILELMKSSGIKIDRQEALEAAAIAKLVADPATVDEYSVTDSNSTSSLPLSIISNNLDGGGWEAPMALPTVAIPSAAVIWLMGVALISFSQRGRRAALREQILAAAIPAEAPWQPPEIPFDVQAAASAANATAMEAEAKKTGPAPAGGILTPPAKADPGKGPPKMQIGTMS